MKSKISTIVVSAIASILLIGAIIYLVSEIHTPPPRITQYECAVDRDLLISKIDKFCAGRHNLKFEVTDTIVDQNNRYAVYAIVTTIVKQDSVAYGLKFEANPSKFNSTIVSTAKGHNKSPGPPGYANEAMHFKQPGGDFNSIFLIPLQKDLGIKFTPYLILR